MISSSESRAHIDSCLENLYQSWREQALGIDPLYGELLAEMRTLILRGGKRQRPYLSYLAYAGLGGSDVNAFLSVAAGLEIFHNFLLIHDDVIDRDHVRYGGPNLTGVYYQKLKARGCDDTEADHFAEMAAVLAGDAASSMVRANLYSSSFPSHAKLECLQMLDQALFFVGGGEYVDALVSPLGEVPMKYSRILSVYEYKTARYSFDLSLQFGACLSGAQYDTNQLTAFSVPLGIAFQMRDDYIGLFGDENKTGKPVMGDLREGKQTALYALTLELADEKQKKQLNKVYGQRMASEAELYTVRQICQSSGACEALELEISRYGNKADEALAKIHFLPEYEAALRRFIDTSIRRDV